MKYRCSFHFNYKVCCLFSVMGKSINQILYLLAFIDRKEDISSDTWLTYESEFNDNLEMLLELDLVSQENSEYVLTNKGRNILNYMYRYRREEAPIKM